MKISKKMWIIAIFLTMNVMAVDLGERDISFSNDSQSDGWDLNGNGDFNSYGGDVVVDSLRRIYVLGARETETIPSILTTIRLMRYLPNGSLDTSFSGDGIIDIADNASPFGTDSRDDLSIKLVLDDSNGVFVGYTKQTCGNTGCENDAWIKHIDANANELGFVSVHLDLGNTTDRQDEIFRDLVYIPSLNKIGVTFEVETPSAGDTDFGVALINVNSSNGGLSLDLGFDTDGKNRCWFDQGGSGNNKDNPQAIVWDSINNRLFVGGTIYEGNGQSSVGENLGFCEFTMTGVKGLEWSTKDIQFSTDSVETMSDMKMIPISATHNKLIVAGVTTDSDRENFTVFSYFEDGTGFHLDTSFGSNVDGSTSTGFSFLNLGATIDIPSELIVNEDGSIFVAGTMHKTPGMVLLNSSIGIAKFTKDGILDTNWGIGHSGRAIHTFDNQFFEDYAGGLAEDPVTHDLFIAGYSDSPDRLNILVAKFHNDLIYANNFDF